MASYATISGARDTWVNLVAVNATLSAIPVTVQNLGGTQIMVFEGGASAPASTNDGIELMPRAAMNVNSAYIWVRGLHGLSVAITDTK